VARISEKVGVEGFNTAVFFQKKIKLSKTPFDSCIAVSTGEN